MPNPRPGLENAIHVEVGEAVYFFPAGSLLAERWSDGSVLRLEPADGGEVRFEIPGLYRVAPPEESGAPLEESGGAPPAVSRRTQWVYIVVDPPLSMRLYTIIPRVCGPISGWTKILDRIADLGFDTLQILPLTEMGPSLSPYSISDHFSIDPSHAAGSGAERLAAFDDFIDECSSRSIRVCIDLVLNHVAIGGRVARDHLEWLADDPDEADGIRRAGWSDGEVWHPWRDLAKLDFESYIDADSEALCDYLYEYARFWTSRVDRTQGIIRLDNLHSSDSAFTRKLLRRLRREFPSVTILGELFGEERMIRQTTNSLGINLLLGTPWEHKFVPKLRAYLKYIHSKFDRLHYLVPVTSHDSGSVVDEFGTHEATPARLVASFLLGTGSTGIVMGTEYGASKIEMMGPPEPFSMSVAGEFDQLIWRVNTLHREEPLLRRTGNLIFVDSYHEAIIAAVRIEPETGLPRFLVCANFDPLRDHLFVLPPPAPGPISLLDLLSERELSWSEALEIPMESGGVSVFRCVHG